MKNKIIAAILTIAIVCSSAAVLSFAQSVTLGDINKDGQHTASDARQVLRMAAQLDPASEEDKKIADTNFDGNVTAADARTILRYSAKLDPIPEVTFEVTTESSAGETTVPSDEPTTNNVAEPTTATTTETTTEEPSKVVDEYPAAIDAFFAGKFYMEAIAQDGNLETPVKFATKNNNVEIVMPIEGIEVSIFMNGGVTYMKLVDSSNKKYYANLSDLMKAFNVDLDFDYLLDGITFGIVEDYGKPVLTKEKSGSTVYDVYTFTVGEKKIAFYAVNGEIKEIYNIMPDPTNNTQMTVITLSEKIPPNMLTTRGYTESTAKIISILSEIM